MLLPTTVLPHTVCLTRQLAEVLYGLTPIGQILTLTSPLDAETPETAEGAGIFIYNTVFKNTERDSGKD